MRTWRVNIERVPGDLFIGGKVREPGHDTRLGYRASHLNAETPTPVQTKSSWRSSLALVGTLHALHQSNQLAEFPVASDWLNIELAFHPSRITY